MFDNVTLKLNADPLIISALKEDITSEDVSTNSVMPEPKKGEVQLICKQDGIICGLPIFARVFTLLDENTVVDLKVKDGDKVTKGELLAVVTGDIKEASKIFGGATFDVVTCNPPYMTEHHGLTSLEEPKAIARHEIKCTLEDVIRETSKVLRPGGRFYMVHRPRRLAEIIHLMREYKIEPKRLRMVHPFQDKEANILLIEGLRGGGTMMKVEAPLVVYESQGVYTEEVLRIYGKI